MYNVFNIPLHDHFEMNKCIICVKFFFVVFDLLDLEYVLGKPN